MDDELRSEYDLTNLRVRRVGSGRKTFGGVNIRLEPDVAEIFPILKQSIKLYGF